jgi:hypothetical protein
MPQSKVDMYRFLIYSTRPTTNLDPNQWVAKIRCFKQTTPGTFKYSGEIYFHADGTPLPLAGYEESPELIFLHFNLCQFDATIELLRTEEPLWLTYVSGTNAYLRSGPEPTGEEETP